MRGRVVPLLLMLVLGLDGIGPCLCTGEPVPSTAAPHACCEHAKTGTAGDATASAAVKQCSPPCAGTHGALAVAVSANDELKAVPLADTPAISSPAAHGSAATLLAKDASQRHSPPLHSTVLRI